jgi:hypothetical protein
MANEQCAAVCGCVQGVQGATGGSDAVRLVLGQTRHVGMGRAGPLESGHRSASGRVGAWAPWWWCGVLRLMRVCCPPNEKTPIAKAIL